MWSGAPTFSLIQPIVGSEHGGRDSSLLFLGQFQFLCGLLRNTSDKQLPFLFVCFVFLKDSSLTTFLEFRLVLNSWAKGILLLQLVR